LAFVIAAIIISCLAVTIIGLPVENNDGNLLTNINPELTGGAFEGDIILPPNFMSTRGVAANGQIHRWPNKVIPYDISAITNANDQQTITIAMNRLMFDVATSIPDQTSRKVCVLFRPAQSSDQQVLKIQYGNGCSSSVGYGTFQKTMNLQQNGCFRSGTIQHELMHVLGFFHEQSRPDRDSYITIHQENISPDLAHNFDKYEWGVVAESQGTGYDYGSLMHYPRDAFSANGQPTITTHESNAVIGQREKLSATDILEIRAYYQC